MTYTVGIDVGGTFTDFLVAPDDGTPAIPHKSPSTPANPADGVICGLREIAELLGLPAEEFARSVSLIVHGTTVATNAVLTGDGAKTGLITTEGFRDILEMRRGIRSRKHLYDNKYVAPEALATREARVTVKERVDVQGRIVTPLDDRDVEDAVDALKEADVDAVAICFMHSYAEESHERRALEIVRERFPDAFVSASVDVLPHIRLYPRVSTTVMNAYLGPVVERYMGNLVQQLDGLGFDGVLMIMQSNGGIARPASVADLPASIAMSGPAAGPVAGLAYVRQRGIEDCIIADMGGTSYDASLVKDGEVQITREGEINRQMISLPTTQVHTIGAGGGSIGWIDDGGRLRVGPRSAGAVPGPAAYGQGGSEPTVTDADLVLGYIDPEYFLGGRMPLDRARAEESIRRQIADPLGTSVLEAAAGVFEMVNLAMADGTRNVTVEAGYDPREFPLVVAGGAGALHCGMIAQELGITSLIIPKLSSVICASGMMMADLRHDFVRGFHAFLSNLDFARARVLIIEMVEEGSGFLRAEGASDGARFTVSADLRYLGQHHEIILTFPLDMFDQDDESVKAAIAGAYHARHEELYGFSEEHGDIEVLSLRVTASAPRKGIFDRKTGSTTSGTLAEALKTHRAAYLRSEGRQRPIPVYDGAKIPIAERLEGPCLVEEPQTTIFVPEYFDITLDAGGYYHMFAKEQS